MPYIKTLHSPIEAMKLSNGDLCIQSEGNFRILTCTWNIYVYTLIMQIQVKNLRGSPHIFFCIARMVNV